MKPNSIIQINITTLHPYEENPEKCDKGSMAPIFFEIEPHKNPKALPQGMIVDIRSLLESAAEHCRAYVNSSLAAAPETPKIEQSQVGVLPSPMKEDERICARCQFVESECMCEEGFLES